MVKELFPKGPTRWYLGLHRSQPFRLRQPARVSLPLKNLGLAQLAHVPKCPFDGSLLGDSADIFRAENTLVPSFFISLAFSDVLAVVDFHGGTCPRPAQYY